MARHRPTIASGTRGLLFVDNPTASPGSAPPTTPPVSASPDSTPGTTPGSQPAATTTTTAPPAAPVAVPTSCCCSSSESVELAARDLYQSVLDRTTTPTSSSEPTASDATTVAGDYEGLLVTLRENHEEYANVIAGVVGRPAVPPSREVLDQFSAGFASADIAEIVSTAYDLESTLVATHPEVIGRAGGCRRRGHDRRGRDRRGPARHGAGRGRRPARRSRRHARELRDTVCLANRDEPAGTAPGSTEG